MASQIDRPARDGGRLLSAGLVRVDPRDVDRPALEGPGEVALDLAGRRKVRHRNATAKNAHRATVIATLLSVSS